MNNIRLNIFTSGFKNKKSSFLLAVFILIIFIGQSVLSHSKEVSSANTTAIEKTETCRSNPKHAYQVFVPSVRQDENQLPLLVLIDPHGDGKLAVDRFKEAAQKYRVIVVGSNLIKNNDPDYLSELDELIADVKSRYPAGDLLFTGGFSGGARMALSYAVGHKTNGVLACGALAQNNEIDALTCRVMCLIGIEDFNFIEAAPFVLNPMAIPSNLAIELTEATHEWPEREQLSQAFGNLILSVMPPGTLAEKKQYVKEYVDEEIKRAGEFEINGEYLQAMLVLHNMMSNAYFNHEKDFMSLADVISNKSEFQNQGAELDKNVRFEVKVRNSYLNAMTQKDSTWWKSETDILKTKISEEKNEFALHTYKRIKGFLGIACYSLSNRYIEEKDAQNLKKVLMVYQLVEPENSAIPGFLKTLDKLNRELQK